MSTPETADDPTMKRITEAVTAFHDGEVESARTELRALWDRIGVLGDALHRCSLAHYLADMFDDPAQALVWDVRALDAADALGDERAREHHDSLRVAGFYPSLHLNLADDLRRLGSFDAATVHIVAARGHLDALDHDGYGAMIRRAVDDVAADIERKATQPRPSAPGR